MKNFDILKVSINDQEFVKGETVIHFDGSYTVKIEKFCVSDTNPQNIWFYFEKDLVYVKDLNNFRKIPE